MIRYKDIEKYYNRSFGLDIKFHLKYILRNWDDEEVQEIIKVYEARIKDVVQRLKKTISVPYYLDMEELKRSIISLDFERIFEEDVSVIVYISAGDDMTIGLIFHPDNTFEPFEGNDEATDETITLINSLLYGNKDIWVSIYSSHGLNVIKMIEAEHMLPPNLYVSPSRMYASRYWSIDEERMLFTGKVNLKDISQESDIDWKTVRKTPIKNFRIL